MTDSALVLEPRFPGAKPAFGWAQHVSRSEIRVKPTSPAQTDAALFLQFREGSDAAFTRLYERHQDRLFRYALKLCKDSEAAQDIVHSVWERLIEERSSTAKIENVVGFLVRSTRNLTLDYLKHARFQTPLDTSNDELQKDWSSLPSELTEEEELVIQALSEISEESRHLLILHYYSGYSFEEIAAIWNKRPNAIWTRASRARSELKKLVEKKIRASNALSARHSRLEV